MSNRPKPSRSGGWSNPRKVTQRHGIIGGGDPHGQDDVLIEATNAVLHDETEVALFRTPDGQRGVVLVLSGRIARSQDRARVCFLLGAEGVANIMTELAGVLGRADAADAEKLMFDLMVAMRRMRKDGLFDPKDGPS